MKEDSSSGAGTCFARRPTAAAGIGQFLHSGWAVVLISSRIAEVLG